MLVAHFYECRLYDRKITMWFIEMALDEVTRRIHEIFGYTIYDVRYVDK